MSSNGDRAVISRIGLQDLQSAPERTKIRLIGGRSVRIRLSLLTQGTL
jgi:hypothetical protein